VQKCFFNLNLRQYNSLIHHLRIGQLIIMREVKLILFSRKLKNGKWVSDILINTVVYSIQCQSSSLFNLWSSLSILPTSLLGNRVNSFPSVISIFLLSSVPAGTIQNKTREKKQHVSDRIIYLHSLVVYFHSTLDKLCLQPVHNFTLLLFCLFWNKCSNKTGFQINFSSVLDRSFSNSACCHYLNSPTADMITSMKCGPHRNHCYRYTYRGKDCSGSCSCELVWLHNPYTACLNPWITGG